MLFSHFQDNNWTTLLFWLQNRWFCAWWQTDTRDTISESCWNWQLFLRYNGRILLEAKSWYNFALVWVLFNASLFIFEEGLQIKEVGLSVAVTKITFTKLVSNWKIVCCSSYGAKIKEWYIWVVCTIQFLLTEESSKLRQKENLWSLIDPVIKQGNKHI